MGVLDTAYLIITGAGIAGTVAPDLIAGLIGRFPIVLTIPTPNAARVVDRGALARLPGHRIVESYFDNAILPRPPLGMVVVAPCGFNSLNKLAAGFADNLALSVVAEAIGRGTPVVVGIACNAPLWAHPRAAESARTLRQWGCTVLDPVQAGERVELTSVADILAAVDAYGRGPDDGGMGAPGAP
jgi:phosphopantothenoylcysteine synthetase/decarboxylase